MKLKLPDFNFACFQLCFYFNLTINWTHFVLVPCVTTLNYWHPACNSRITVWSKEKKLNKQYFLQTSYHLPVLEFLTSLCSPPLLSEQHWSEKWLGSANKYKVLKKVGYVLDIVFPIKDGWLWLIGMFPRTQVRYEMVLSNNFLESTTLLQSIWTLLFEIYFFFVTCLGANVSFNRKFMFIQHSRKFSEGHKGD